MQLLDSMFRLPVDLELWIVLCYVAVVLIGARITELLARMHFARARRRAERGFEYIAEEDHYRCSEGERLVLDRLEHERGIAVYQAPAETCARCALKKACTPQSDGRRLYRSLITWAETDLGRFHRRISALMFGAAGVLTLAAVFRWSGSPGTGYLLAGLVASSASLAWDLRVRDSRSESPGPPAASGLPAQAPR